MSVFHGADRIAPEPGKAPDTSSMTRTELAELAASMGIEVPARATKAQIAELVAAAG